MAVGVFLPPPITKGTIFLAILVFGLIWVVVQRVGGILAGGATDPEFGTVGDPVGIDLLAHFESGRIMIPAPSWLYYLFGALVLVVAAYGVVLLIFSVSDRRLSGWDVDVSHIFMGVSMSGMFVTRWAFGPSVMWELIFSALLIWFSVRSVQSIQRWGPHLTHFLIHAVMSFAMLLMYWFPMQMVSAHVDGFDVHGVDGCPARSGPCLSPGGNTLRIGRIHSRLSLQGGFAPWNA